MLLPSSSYPCVQSFIPIHPLVWPAIAHKIHTSTKIYIDYDQSELLHFFLSLLCRGKLEAGIFTFQSEEYDGVSSLKVQKSIINSSKTYYNRYPAEIRALPWFKFERKFKNTSKKMLSILLMYISKDLTFNEFKCDACSMVLVDMNRIGSAFHYFYLFFSLSLFTFHFIVIVVYH